MRDIVAKIKPLGWHIVVHFDSHWLKDLAPFLKELDIVTVIDHMGRIDAGAGVGQQAFQLLLELMEDERFWVKVCGSERLSRSEPPFHKAAEYGRLLVEKFPIASCGAPTGRIPISTSTCPMTGSWWICSRSSLPRQKACSDWSWTTRPGSIGPKRCNREGRRSISKRPFRCRSVVMGRFGQGTIGGIACPIDLHCGVADIIALGEGLFDPL